MTKAANFDFFYDLAIDEKSAAEGKTFEFNGFKFQLAYADSPEFRMEVAAQWRKHLGEKALTDLPEAEQSKLARQVTDAAVAEKVLLGWEGVIPFKGEELAYSNENALKLLSVAAFRKWMEKVVSDDESFRVQRPTEVEVKN